VAERTWLATETMSSLPCYARNPRRGCDICSTSSRMLLDGNVPLADDASLRDDFRCTSSGFGLVFRQDSVRKMLILRQDTT